MSGGYIMKLDIRYAHLSNYVSFGIYFLAQIENK